MIKLTSKLNIAVRFIVSLLCITLIIGALSVSSFALDGKTGNLSWSLSGGILSISGKGDMPDYADGNMAPWYDSARSITRVVVREGVTSIGTLAFYGCTRISSCSIATTIKSIGDRAFKNCESLKYMTLPDAIESIGEAAFENCKSLKSISLPEGLKSIGDYAFNLCSSLSSVTVPSTTSNLGMAIFADCTGLSQVTILASTTKIPDWTFYGCSSLNWIVIPETVTETGSEAFHDCSSLEVVYYSGDSDVIKNTLVSNPSTSTANVSKSEVPSEKTNSSSSVLDASTGSTTTTVVNNTPGATITQTTTKDYTYTIDGKEVSFDDFVASADDSNAKSTSTTNVTIDVTIKNSDGWSDLSTAIDNAQKDSKDESPVNVNVYVGDSKVNGEQLGELSGKNAIVTINTENGSKVTIDTSEVTKKDLGDKDYDFSFNVDKLDKNNTGIESDTVYKVNFNSSYSFSANVGINVKTGNSYQYATLYAKTAFNTTELQTVIVDENGVAWFNMDGIDKDVTYYIGINVDSVDKSKAIVPNSLADVYQMDNTLTDQDGIRYEIGERTSSWGITSKQFTIYVLIGLGIIAFISVLVVVLLMRISKSRAKYAIPDGSKKPKYEEKPLDEEEIRMQVMREMIAEKQKKSASINQNNKPKDK